MEIKKCTQCGGNLEHLRLQKVWRCPFCGVRYEDDAKEQPSSKEENFGLNDEVFSIETDLSKLMKKDGASGCIRSIAHCMRTYTSSDQVEAYMLKKLSFSDDISVKGVREDQIENAMPLMKTVMGPGERVIVYGNKGIFSKGKEYFAVTDRRSIFVEKKIVKSLLHTDIDAIKVEACGNCCLNEDYGKSFINLDSKGTFQGALIALICMFAFEEDPEREKIRLI